MSPAARAKISAALRGKSHPHAGHPSSRKGTHLSASTRSKISASTRARLAKNPRQKMAVALKLGGKKQAINVSPRSGFM